MPLSTEFRGPKPCDACLSGSCFDCTGGDCGCEDSFHAVTNGANSAEPVTRAELAAFKRAALTAIERAFASVIKSEPEDSALVAVALDAFERQRAAGMVARN